MGIVEEEPSIDEFIFGFDGKEDKFDAFSPPEHRLRTADTNKPLSEIDPGANMRILPKDGSVNSFLTR